MKSCGYLVLRQPDVVQPADDPGAVQLARRVGSVGVNFGLHELVFGIRIWYRKDKEIFHNYLKTKPVDF
jgi:hypothetical protein